MYHDLQMQQQLTRFYEIFRRQNIDRLIKNNTNVHSIPRLIEIRGLPQYDNNIPANPMRDVAFRNTYPKEKMVFFFHADDSIVCAELCKTTLHSDDYYNICGYIKTKGSSRTFSYDIDGVYNSKSASKMSFTSDRCRIDFVDYIRLRVWFHLGISDGKMILEGTFVLSELPFWTTRTHAKQSFVSPSWRGYLRDENDDGITYNLSIFKDSIRSFNSSNELCFLLRIGESIHHVQGSRMISRYPHVSSFDKVAIDIRGDTMITISSTEDKFVLEKENPIEYTNSEGIIEKCSIYSCTNSSRVRGYAYSYSSDLSSYLSSSKYMFFLMICIIIIIFICTVYRKMQNDSL